MRASACEVIQKGGREILKGVIQLRVLLWGWVGTGMQPCHAVLLAKGAQIVVRHCTLLTCDSGALHFGRGRAVKQPHQVMRECVTAF